MTEQELQVIKQRAELATLGRWEVRNDNEGTEYRPFYVISEVDADSGEWFAEVHVGCKNDAEFIAHARQDVPALIAEVERYKKLFEKCADDTFNAKEELRKAKNENERLRKQQLQMMSDHTNDLEVLDEYRNANKSLRKALAFYANKQDFMDLADSHITQMGNTEFGMDKGERARKALSGEFNE